MPETGDEPLVLRDDAIDVAAIMARVRARIALRSAVPTPLDPDRIAETSAARLRDLAKWNFPTATYHAMWPPHLEPWNLEQDFPLRSHRPGLGVALVAGKRVLRAALRWLLRPLVAQQVEINRALALVLQTLERDAALQREQTRALEARIARVGAMLGEIRGTTPPLVRFADGEQEPRR